MTDNKRKNSLDCLLISPPAFYNRENIWREINSNFPPLGLASIAGYIREQGRSVRIIDCNIVSPSVNEFKNYFYNTILKKYSSINFIGITGVTGTIKKAYEIARVCRKIYPNAKIIIGGVHATFVSDEVINLPFVDYAVIGEGELTLSELLAGVNISRINGLVYKKIINGKAEIIYNPPRDRIINLDSLPMPAYNLLPMDKYRPAKGSYKRLPAMAMMTSRGCPGRCTFCSKTLGNRLVFKSATTIFNEIKYLISSYGIKEIIFYDDTFTVNKANVLALCGLIIENKTDITWTCFARVDFIDSEMLNKMKTAGCHQIMYGVENINEAVLKNINKKINPGQVERAVELTKKAEIECRLAFMVGNPGDNYAIIKENIRFIKKLDPDLLIVNITTPFPGTEMFKWAKEKNLILTYNWDDYTLAKPVMRLENLSADEIKSLYKLIYRSFYMRPGFIIKKIRSINSWEDIKILLSGLKALLSFFIKKTA